jgi:hypothetical protein
MLAMKKILFPVLLLPFFKRFRTYNTIVYGLADGYAPPTGQLYRFFPDAYGKILQSSCWPFRVFSLRYGFFADDTPPLGR